jgi:hypothetical protein
VITQKTTVTRIDALVVIGWSGQRISPHGDEFSVGSSNRCKHREMLSANF